MQIPVVIIGGGVIVLAKLYWLLAGSCARQVSRPITAGEIARRIVSDETSERLVPFSPLRFNPFTTIPLNMTTTSVQQTLFVNGDVKPFETSLAAVLQDFGIEIEAVRGVAVAVNDAVIRKSDWQSYELSPEDRVEIVTARQGG